MFYDGWVEIVVLMVAHFYFYILPILFFPYCESGVVFNIGTQGSFFLYFIFFYFSPIASIEVEREIELNRSQKDIFSYWKQILFIDLCAVVMVVRQVWEVVAWARVSDKQRQTGHNWCISLDSQENNKKKIFFVLLR